MKGKTEGTTAIMQFVLIQMIMEYFVLTIGHMVHCLMLVEI